MIRTKRSHLSVAAFSHAGLSGKKNEDRYATAAYAGEAQQPILFAVISDGIGGHRAGEVAAELAVNYIIEKVSESDGRRPLEIMEAAIHSASQAIASRSASHADQAGMGATCACAWVAGDELYTAHVGDSRIYLVRAGTIHRITVDHTWVQEALEQGIITPDQARDHPNVHVLRRHLGSIELPDVDFHQNLNADEDDQQTRDNQGMDLKPGDVLLLCTDGLTDLVWDDEILRLITSGKALKSVAEDLAAQANERGGYDNITVMLIRVPQPGTTGGKKKRGVFQNPRGNR